MYNLVVQGLDPYTFLLSSLVAATIWSWRRQRPQSRPLVVSSILLALIVILSTPVAAHWALYSLDDSFPLPGVPAPGDTIVVLSGGLYVDDDDGKQFRLDESSLQRCLYAARLYREAGHCRVLLTGGKVDWTTPGPTFAAAMRDFMLLVGVRPDDITVEEKSSTTYENALYSKELLDPDGDARVWLVTEAFHMNRSRRCFLAQGIEVTPAPCDAGSRRWKFELSGLIPSARGFALVSRASHEWLGSIWYKLRGRI